MRPFAYIRGDDRAAVAEAFTASGRQGPPTSARVQFIAGGTTILDLMKLDVMQPGALVDISGSKNSTLVEEAPDNVRLGALARMADVANHPLVRRDYPVIADSLVLAASAQLRNMATVGGNVLQRTRCSYFRDPSWTACNKRAPGSGCAALDGFNRSHAVLGVSSHCIATYPGDFAQALIALDAVVETRRAGERRRIPFTALHQASGRPARRRDYACAGRNDRRLRLTQRQLDAALALPQNSRPRILRVRPRLCSGRARYAAGRPCAPGSHRARRRRHRAVAGAGCRSASGRAADHRADRATRRGSGLRRRRTSSAQRLQDRAGTPHIGARALGNGGDGDLIWRLRLQIFDPRRMPFHGPTPA